MKCRSSLLLACVFLFTSLADPSAFAQCNSRLLAALDEGQTPLAPQTFDVSVWTTDAHCPASGQLDITTVPPGAAVIGSYVTSFFDVFLEAMTVKPVVTPTYPVGIPFQLVANAVYSDPVYPPQTYIETVMVNPVSGRLQIVRPGGTCTDNVPTQMTVGQSACFLVCHKIYRILLVTPPLAGQPLIRVSPGCLPQDGCVPMACTPGGEQDYRCTVYQSGGQWYLEFEYSNPLNEPACYCVSYTGNLPANVQTHGLLALNQTLQSCDLTLWTTGNPEEACGAYEIFSYPTGIFVHEPIGGFSAGPEQSTLHIPVTAGSFLPGQQFELIGYADFGAFGVCADFASRWLVETVQVLPNGGLQIVDRGSECAVGGGGIIPPSLALGQAQCLRVCHDVYYVPLVFPGPGIPHVTITPGCGGATPCPAIPGCTAGSATDYVYEVFEIGGTWLLRFEYSNPSIEPVCYCVAFDNMTPVPGQVYELAALDAAQQTLNLTLWTSSPTLPAAGRIGISSEPPGAFIGPYAPSYFEVYDQYYTQYVPVGPGEFTPGQTFQLVATINAPDFELVPQPYVENVIVTAAGTLTPWYPVPSCADFVPPSMVPGQSACFTVCHGVYRVNLAAPPGDTPPVVSVVPGCASPCVSPGCRPGGSNDFVYHVISDGSQWILVFEYSNPYVQPVCYCVSVEAPPCQPVTDLVIQWPDSAAPNIRLSWLCPQTSLYRIYSSSNPGNHGDPPGPDWTDEDLVSGTAGDRIIWSPASVSPALYRNFVVKSECGGDVLRR